MLTPQPITPSPANLTRLGLGCAPIGDLYTAVTDADATATIATAYDSGVRFFDTAPHYGAGLSESRLGAALRGVERDSYTLATKVGRTIVDAHGVPVAAGECGDHTEIDLSYDGVMRSLEASTMRLGVDRFDLLYLHDPTDVDQALDGAYRALQELRAQGVVRAIGVGMNFSAPLARFCAEGAPDVVMIAGRYSLLDRSAATELFPIAQKHGVQITAAGVFNSGILAAPKPGAYYDYRPATDSELARATGMEAKCLAAGVSLAAAAMQFPLQHEAVGAVVVGARSEAEVTAMVTNAGAQIPQSLWSDLDE